MLVTDLSALYRQHASDVFRFAMHLTRDRHEAEDITSETFVRAWAAPDRIRVATVKGYLFTIARNLWLQRLRRTRRHVELSEELVAPGPDPGHRAEQAAEVEAVLAKLTTLPEVDRSALWLRAEGLAYEEIARALDLSVGAARVKVHRARRALLDLEDA